MKNIVLLFTALLLSNFGFSQSKTASEYIEKANLQLKKKNYEEAFNTLSLAIDEMPDSVSLYDMRGTLLETFRMYPEAIKDFTLGIEKTTDLKIKAHLLANRGGTKYRIRDYAGSYNDLIKAVDLDSTNIAALNNLAAVCEEVDKPDETLKYLNQIIRIDSNYVPAYVNLGFKYQSLGNHQLAIEYFNFAVKLAPEEPLGYSNRSYSKLKTNDLKGALKDINKSIKLFPTNSYAYKIRALIYLEKNKLDKVCSDLTKAEELGYTQQYGEEVNTLKKKYCK